MAEVLTEAPAELKTTGTETITPIQPASTQPTETMTGSEASNLLSFYGVDPNQVYSDANIQSTISRPEAAPDDLLGIRDQIQYDTGYSEAKAKYDAIDKAINDYNQQSKQGVLDIGQWLQRNEAVVGEQEAYLGQRNLGLENLLLEKNTLGKRLSDLSEEVNYRTAIAEKNIDYVRDLKMQFPGAGFKMGDSMDKMESRLEKYIKKEEKRSEKKAYKEALRELGLSTKGSRRELERRLRKHNKEAYARAKEAEDIGLEKARLELQKLREKSRGGSINVASLFGDSGGAGDTTNTYFDNNGNGYSVAQNNSYNDPLGSFGY